MSCLFCVDILMYVDLVGPFLIFIHNFKAVLPYVMIILSKCGYKYDVLIVFVIIASWTI